MQEFVCKKNLTETLRRLKKGDSMVVKNRDFKMGSGQAAKRALEKEGIILRISEKGMVDEWLVERLN